jgi:hypothetical protein
MGTVNSPSGQKKGSPCNPWLLTPYFKSNSHLLNSICQLNGQKTDRAFISAVGEQEILVRLG